MLPDEVASILQVHPYKEDDIYEFNDLPFQRTTTLTGEETMDKINAATNDVTQENIEKIIGLFPQGGNRD